MGKGSGGSTSTSYSSNYPAWAKDAYETNVRRASTLMFGELGRPGQRPFNYQGPRIAGRDERSLAASQGREDMFLRGDPLGDYSSRQLEYAGTIPTQFQDLRSNYGPRRFDAGRFDEAAQRQYMSPYVQNVIQGQLRSAQKEYARQENKTAAQNVAAGAMGGYREAVQGALGDSLQGQVMSDITGKGLHSAFENAQMQFERDRSAAIEAARMGDASAYQAAQMRMEADVRNQERLQWEGDFSSQLSRQASDLSTIGQARNLQRIAELDRAGIADQDMRQAQMDLDYKQKLDDYNLQRQKIAWISSILTGIPSNLETRADSPGPDRTAQLIGLGLQAAGSGMFNRE
tara:strand:+ start:2324 stop:3358 length:1035 start_codon:yes stop_codon:yes gene_type:complete